MSPMKQFAEALLSEHEMLPLGELNSVFVTVGPSITGGNRLPPSVSCALGDADTVGTGEPLVGATVVVLPPPGEPAPQALTTASMTKRNPVATTWRALAAIGSA